MMPLFKGWINPLKCPQIDDAPEGAASPTAEQLLEYLFAPELDRSCDAFVARYRQIASVPDPLCVAPAEPNILQKMVWPLRYAKSSYALGNYLGCIALCGMVGEMAAILLWEISKVTLQHKPLDEAAQTALLGSSFEKLTQERRARVLRALGLIGDETKAAFDGLRLIRKRYLHLFSQPHAQVDVDAKQAYQHALAVVDMVLGLSFKDAGVGLRPDLVAYLAERGVVEGQPEKQGDEGGA